MENMILLKNVSKSYKTKFYEAKAVNNISLQIEKGEFVAITGTSGCGKTTLLNLIGMQDNMDCGKIYIDGQDVSMLNEKEKYRFKQEHIAIIFQFYNLIEVLTLKENIVLPLKLAKKKIDEHMLNEYVEQLRLSEHINRFPNECSGGQQQRAAIIRALMCKSKIILADEPTGNLDEANTKEVIEILKKINKEYEVTIIMVTHDKELAKNAHREIIMSDGQILP